MVAQCTAVIYGPKKISAVREFNVHFSCRTESIAWSEGEGDMGRMVRVRGAIPSLCEEVICEKKNKGSKLPLPQYNRGSLKRISFESSPSTTHFSSPSPLSLYYS